MIRCLSRHLVECKSGMKPAWIIARVHETDMSTCDEYAQETIIISNRNLRSIDHGTNASRNSTSVPFTDEKIIICDEYGSSNLICT